MLDLIAAAGIGGIIGFGTCAFLTMGKVADGDIDRENDAWAAGYDSGYKNGLRDDAHEMGAAHDRCADALETARNRIEYALEQETPNAAHGVKKMCRILRGEL